MDISEKIINIVKENDCLFNLQSKDFKNYYKKEEIWKEVAETLGLTGKLAKFQFNSN